MKNLIVLLAVSLIFTFTATASVDLELDGGMEVVLEWDDGMTNNPSNPDNSNDKYPVFIELSGDLVETDGYVWGKIISDERTNHAGFAGWAPATSISEATQVMRFTSPSGDPHGYGSGNAEGRRYYQVSFGGGSDITRDLQVAFDATNDGISSDPIYVWMNDGTDETWYQPGGSTTPISATSATVPGGTSFWFLGTAEMLRFYAKICFEGAAHIPGSENPNLVSYTREAGNIMHNGYRIFFNNLFGIEAMPSDSPFGDGKTITTPIPDDFVDWVYVYVREGAPAFSGFTTLEEGSAVVTKSGDIVDVDGTLGMPLEQIAATQDVHVVIKHKSHPAVSTVQLQLDQYDSSSPLDLINTDANFAGPAGDDAISNTKRTLAGSEAPQSVFVVVAGDGDFDNSMNFIDSWDSEYTRNVSGQQGYYRADYDMTGFIDSWDDFYTLERDGRFTFIGTDNNLPGNTPLP